MQIIGEIYISGDCHGVYGHIGYWATHGNTPNLVLVGDIGVGYKGNGEKLVELGYKLNKEGKYVYAIRGNHDQPDLFDGRIYGGEYGGIKFVRDGTVANWNNQNILFCGGAVSIDRNNSVPNISWWENEEFVPHYPKQPIHHLITHVSIPEINGISIYSPNVLHWSRNDADLIHDLMMEQQIVRNWFNELLAQKHPIKSWHYGHYHQSIISECKGIKCRCLAINEIAPFNRVAFS